MNWKHLISAILLLVLVPVSAFGLSCEVTCGLASMMAYHQLSRSAGAKASTSMEMSQMDCDSMRQEHRTTVSRVLPDCVLTSQSCDEGACASDSSWLTEQKSLIDHPELTWSSPLMRRFHHRYLRHHATLLSNVFTPSVASILYRPSHLILVPLKS